MGHKTEKTARFDEWMRKDFVELNSTLEEMYFRQEDRAHVEGVGDDLKQQIERQGREHIRGLLSEGNTDEGFEPAFDLLGNVGLYMAACRRHELTEPSRETTSPLVEASALAMHIGASIGVTPRFATAHLTTHNKAYQGIYKRFTFLEDEKIFVDYNTKGILAYKRAADALLKIQPLGISHPIAADLLVVAKRALQDVHESNSVLFKKLNTERFFYSVRPYYKPYRVGSQVYRGANAGDFAGINVIDMLLGLCSPQEASYSQMLVDKFLYMMPEDQAILRDCMRQPNMMDAFLADIESAGKPWYKENLKLFIEVCEVHGQTAVQHHNELVEKYIVGPSATMNQQHMSKVTASGPPLTVLLHSLERLRDWRAAADRPDLKTRFLDLQKLRQVVN